MPGVSGNMVKGYIDDGYDYMLETYDQETLKEVAPKIFAEKEVDGDGWQMTKVVNSGTWKKTEQTEGYTPDQPTDGYTVYARVFTYTQAATFTNDAVKDIIKMKNLLKDLAGGWGITAVETREEFYARVFNQGGITTGDWIFNGTTPSGSQSDSSGLLIYDSTCLFPLTGGTNHTAQDAATYYNGFALSLTPTNLKTVYLHGTGTNNRRENGAQFNNRLDTLLIPVNLSFTADETINSTLVAYESTNTRNALTGKLNIVEWSYLSDTDAFFVGRAKAGITMLKREEPTFDIFQDKVNRCWWIVGEQRFGVMVHDWRPWLGSNMSTA